MAEKKLFYLINGIGETYSMEEGDARSAIKEGWKLETQEEKQTRELEDKYEDRPVAAFAAGTGSALTFGGLDVLARLSGHHDTLRNLKEFNPTAYNVGDIGTTAATILATFGAGAVAKVASKTVPGLIAKQSIKAEKLLLGNLAKKGLTKNQAKIVSRSLGAMPDALAYSFKDALSEEALGDSDFAAERLLANAGLKALINVPLAGTFGGMFGTGEVLIPKAIKSASKGVKSSISKYREVLKKDVETARKTFTELHPSQAEVFDALTEGAFVKGAADPREKLFANALERTDSVNKITKTVSDIFENSEKAGKYFEKNIRYKEVGTMAKELLGDSPINPDIPRQHIAEVFQNRVRPALNTALEDKTHNPTMIKKALTYLDAHEKNIYAPDASISDVFENVMKYKRKVGADVIQFGKKSTNITDAETASFLQNLIYGPVNDHLTNPSLYGQLAAREAAIRKAYERQLAAKNPFMKAFTEKKAIKGKKTNL